MADNIPQLKIGEKVGARWLVEKKLGEGGFGGVYRVIDLQATPKKPWAMKIESAESRSVQCLKMDALVLGLLDDVKGGRHFCRIEDKGRNDKYNYLVMTLVGRSLSDLRKACPNSRFGVTTAIAAGLQCLQAVEDMHNIGYLHRDLKPANFAVGREEAGEQRKVFVLDFGMCRKYVNDDGRIRTPRRVCGFRGTVRYAPLSCHLGREMSRKDDLEIWIYQQIEMTTGQLPWYKYNEKDHVLRLKQRCRTEKGAKQLFGSQCPRQYAYIMKYIDSLKYFDSPDYKLIYKLMNKAATDGQCDLSGPYDWEKGGDHYAKTQRLDPHTDYDPHKDAGGWANW